VHSRFRKGFYGGLTIALLIGLYLTWLWQPERQVKRHTENLLHKIEKKNWAGASDFIGSDYTDQWGDDRALLLGRMRDVFRYFSNVRIKIVDPTLNITGGRGVWRSKITIDGDNSEAMALVKERVNLLASPFELEWRRQSGKPWDWKLVGVSNPNLEIPMGFE
jgi:hypothetical protein